MTCPRKLFYPFAYALYDEELQSRCWYCLQENANLKRCLGCHTALFCKEECQHLGWKDHKAECSAIKACNAIPGIEARLLGRIVLRQKDIMKGRDKKEPNFYKDRFSERTIMEIWSHTKEMKNDQYAMNKFNEIYKQLTNFYDQKHLLPQEIVFELHCRNYINRHAISDRQYTKEVGKGLYLDLCSYDHSCRPNAAYTCDGFVATLRGLSHDTKLADRSSTFYSYIELVSSVPERQKFLKDTWYFDCRCSRCVDNNDNILTAVLCPFCPNASMPLCIFGEWDYKDKTTAIVTCPVCDKVLSQEYVVEAIEMMRTIGHIVNSDHLEKMANCDKMIFLVELLTKADRYLPFVNVFRCKIVQLIIPLVSPFDYAFLLQLHIDTEECVRQCFPKNHPSLAFHLRNIGMFLEHLGKFNEAKKYLEEAVEMLEFTMDADHTLTMETVAALKEVNASISQDPKISEESALNALDVNLNNSTPSKDQEDTQTGAKKCANEGEVLKENILSDNQLNGGQQPCVDKGNCERGNALQADALAALLSEDTEDMPPLIDH